MKAYRGVTVYLLSFVTLALFKVSGQPRAPAALALLPTDLYVWAPQSGRFGKETLPLHGSNHDSLFVRPVAWSVHQICQSGTQEISFK
jgi:hypothetical protein